MPASDDGQAFFAAAVGAWMAEPEAIPKLVSTNYRLHCEKYALMAENASQAARIAALEAENARLRGWQAGQTHYVFEGARRERAENALLEILREACWEWRLTEWRKHRVAAVGTQPTPQDACREIREIARRALRDIGAEAEQ